MAVRATECFHRCWWKEKSLVSRYLNRLRLYLY